ncbi:GATA-type transcription factor [Acrasis kona]|uniref:GATA-type transcription factor n=1 Tax=Acrasis kona TaxID=1008807 RepID=A0AAW2YLN5_9EUKA
MISIQTDHKVDQNQLYKLYNTGTYTKGSMKLYSFENDQHRAPVEPNIPSNEVHFSQQPQNSFYTQNFPYSVAYTHTEPQEHAQFQLQPNNTNHERLVLNSIRILSRPKLKSISPDVQVISVHNTSLESSISTIPTDEPDALKPKLRTGRKSRTLNNKCANCGVGSSPLWRSGPGSSKLCNKCGLYWKRYNKDRPINQREVMNEAQAGVWHAEALAEMSDKSMNVASKHYNDEVVCDSDEMES